MTQQLTSYPPRAGRSEQERWSRVKLIEPSTAGFALIAASSGPWRFPLALPRSRRRKILAILHAAAAAVRRDPRVARADVFKGVLRPPGGPSTNAREHAPDATFDAVLLVETSTVAVAEELLANHVLAELEDELRRNGNRSLAFAGSNARRIGPVDHERQGVFLFNYFSAPSVDTNLDAWQYTAGWFQDETGLDNSTVIQPVEPDSLPYSIVNHCRWDGWRDVVPSLLFKRSFHDYVLRVFRENEVVPRPILYRLDRNRRR